MIKVVFFAPWSDNYLEDTLNDLTVKEDGRWLTIRGTNQIDEADYYVIMDDIPLKYVEMVDKLPDNRKIYFQREPPEIKARRTDISKFLHQGIYIKGHYHVCIPWIRHPFQVNPIFEGRDSIVTICSSKCKTLGQQQRLDLIRRLEVSDINIDIYGRGLEDIIIKNNKYKGIIEGKCKYAILSKYQYALCIENSQHENYFTEKIVDCFLSLTMPIYWGCPNLYKFFPQNSYYQLKKLNAYEKNISKIRAIVKTPLTEERKSALRQARQLVLYRYNIWPTLHRIISFNEPWWHGQFEQDKFVYQTFFIDRNDPGTYLDVGASDGVTFSNTYFFETLLGWRGLCIEPRPDAYEELVQNRNKMLCNTENVAVSGNCRKNQDFLWLKGWGSGLSGLVDCYDLKHSDRIEKEKTHGNHIGSKVIQVDTVLLGELLEKYGMYRIDYISIDIEGAELNVLKSLDFNKFHIKVIDVENNYRDSKIRDFLGSKQYKFVKRLGCDEIYVKIA